MAKAGSFALSVPERERNLPTFGYKQYPWTRQFFETDLRAIPRRKPDVLAVFESYSGLAGEDLHRAFQSGYTPTVRIVNLPGRLGWTPEEGNEIQLDKTFIEELETVLPGNKVPRGRVYAPSELETNLLWILEATVLHELVHFARLKNNEQARLNMKSNKGRAHEEAWADEFEKEAYASRRGMPQSAVLVKWMPKTWMNAHYLRLTR